MDQDKNTPLQIVNYCVIIKSMEKEYFFYDITILCHFI